MIMDRCGNGPVGDSSGGEGAFGGYDGVDECNGDVSSIDGP
jgi:hypothetical protein